MYKRTALPWQDEQGLQVFDITYHEQDQFMDAPNVMPAGSVVWTDPEQFEERPEVGPSDFSRCE